MNQLSGIRILGGNSRYDIFAHWQQALCAAFQRRGVPAELMDIGAELGRGKDDAAVSIGFNLVRHWDGALEQRKHIAWSVDHPVFNQFFFEKCDRNPGFGDNTELLQVDRSRCAVAEKCFGRPRVHFLPHPAVAPSADLSRWSERSYDAVFFGSLADCEPYREQLSVRVAEHLPQLGPYIEQIFAHYSFENCGPLDQVYWHLLVEDLGMNKATARKVFVRTFELLDLYFRSKHRIEFFKSISTCRVHVFGQGPWEKYTSDNVIVHSPVRYAEALEIMKQTKVLLNHAPTLYDGSHERVLDGINSGCRIISTPSRYLEEEFGGQGNILFCELGQESHLDELLSDALNTHAADLEPGQQRIAAAHSMDVRVEQLLFLMRQRWGLTA